jgi:hypothetical protein
LVSAGDEPTNLDAVVVQGVYENGGWLTWFGGLAMMPKPNYAQIEPFEDTDDSCIDLGGMKFQLGCSASGVTERFNLRSSNSYAAGSAMYRILELTKRSDMGAFRAGEISSALNKFESKWAWGGDLSLASSILFKDIFDICYAAQRDGASSGSWSECTGAAGRLLVEVGDHINPQVRNTWLDKVLADTLQVRPEIKNSTELGFGWKGFSVNINTSFTGIPSSISGYKMNLLKDTACAELRKKMAVANCPIG